MQRNDNAVGRTITVTQHDGYCAGRFQAMASPCEVLVDGDDESLAREITDVVAAEAWRIEQKFSRYRDDSIVTAINRANGKPFAVDAETARLLAYADSCFQLSGGAFDITSGVLRKAWKFDGSDHLPPAQHVTALLQHVGWQKVGWGKTSWAEREIVLPSGMEIDLGGIGKEYAVDRALALAMQAVASGVDPQRKIPMLVNFGGDLATNGAAFDKPREWSVGVEAPAGGVAKLLRIRSGALATSGDARRFLLKDGVRYGHILDACTGWPPPGAPRSVSVVAATCVEAGTLSTLAILQGAHAGEYLAAQGVQNWILW